MANPGRESGPVLESNRGGWWLTEDRRTRRGYLDRVLDDIRPFGVRLRRLAFAFDVPQVVGRVVDKRHHHRIDTDLRSHGHRGRFRG